MPGELRPKWSHWPLCAARRQALLAVVWVLLAATTVACGGDRVTDPERARTCGELVEAGRAVAEAVLQRLGERPVGDGSSEEIMDSYNDIRRLMRIESFQQRAVELGCGEDDLRRRACTTYRGLAAESKGDMAREFLAPYFAACD